VTLLANEPDNNVIRVSLQALAAVLGGTQSLHTDSRDEALALPSEESARIALRTQQVIAHESGVADAVDPVGGSYFLESLTSSVEERVWAYLRKIEDLGGMLKAVQAGFVQTEIQDSAFEAQKRLESRDQIVVALNAFAEGRARPRFRLYYPPRRLERDQIASLRRLKKSRSARTVKASLSDLGRAAGSEENLLPFMIAAASSEATLGEISDALRTVFGTHRETIVI
jgi:methylmalonyl-CoA mutase N-terminal domain/subunit